MAGPAGGSEAASGRLLAAGPWLRWLAVAGWAEVVLLLAASRAPDLRVPPIVAYAIAFMVVSGFAVISSFACPRVGRRALALLALPAAALLAVAAAGGADLDTAVVVTAALLLGATLLGAVVGGAVEHPGHLIFVVVVSSAADFFSVFHEAGPSHAIVESEVALSVLALPWPMLGTPNIEAFLGAGDLVFTALYVAVARRHGLSLARTAVALVLAYVATMAAVIVLAATLPALPFLGLGMLLVHPSARKPPAQDRVRGTVVAALVVGAVALMFLL